MADNVNSTTGHESETINVQDSKAQFQKFKDEVVDQGYKPNVHTGLADNLFGETQTNDVFTFRPTAGIQDVESGDAPVGGGTIKKVDGNSISWNQGFPYDSSRWYGTGDISFDNDVMVYHPYADVGYAERYLAGAVINGHVYYTCMTIIEMTASNFRISESDNSHFVIASAIGKYSSVRTATFDTTLKIVVVGTSSQQVTAKNIMFIDLTLMFGAGNEPSTVAEFETWLSNNIGLKEYYPYNAGELIPVKDFKVKSVGFNALDESKVTEAKTQYNGYDVYEIKHYNRFIGTYPAKLMAGKTYYIQFDAMATIGNLGQIQMHYVFKDGTVQINNGNNWLFASSGTWPATTSPVRCYATITPVKDVVAVGFGYYYSGATLYIVQGSMVINLSYDGDRDGEYEEHWEREVGIDVTKLYGKLNGTGESVQVFPDGLKAAGSVKDEIVKRGEQVVAIKRVGVVDLGSFTWVKAEGPRLMTDITFDYKVPLYITIAPNAITPMYSCVAPYVNFDNVDKVFTLNGGLDGVIIIADTSYSDAETFKSDMQGVMLYYELATPEEYILDEDILPIQYRVDNYGTEEVLLGNDEEIVSCSPTMTIRYGINAADTIADLPHSYVSVLPQQLDEDKQKQARQNINAASQDSIIRIQEQLDAINPKVDNDVYVDMGLPSGLLWAKRNIDVTQPDGFAASEYSIGCSFFSWGNIDGHKAAGGIFDYSFDATTYASTQGSKLTGNISLSYDAARAACGAPWRMPSSEEFQELFDNCDFIDANGDVIASTQADKLVTMSSVVGIRLKSKINGGILFLPCCGYGSNTGRVSFGSVAYYPSSARYSDGICKVLYATGSSIDPQANTNKYYGFPIRPVM